MPRRFAVPDIYCPFPPGLNPHADDSDAYSLEWGRRFGLLEDGDVFGIARTRLGYLSAYVYPRLSREALRVATVWFEWLMIYDDLFVDEHPNARRWPAAEVAAFQDRAVAIMGGSPAHASDGPLQLALADIRDGLLRLRPDWRMDVFLRRFRNYLQATTWERSQLVRGGTPRLPNYVNMRRHTGCLFACYEADCVMGGIHLGPEVRDHLAVENLQILANNYTCWINDIYSWEHEYADGKMDNLVGVIQREFGITFEAALVRAADMCRVEAESYQELRARLPELGVAVDADLEAFLANLESWMRGLRDWSLMTRRYEVAPGALTPAT